MGQKFIRLIGIVILGVVVFKVVLSQSSAAPPKTVEVLPESAFPAGSGMNQGEVPVTRVVYVTATPLPTPTAAPTEEAAEKTAESNPLAVIEQSPDTRIGIDMQPTFRLVFNRFIPPGALDSLLTVEPEIELTTHWESGNVLLIRPLSPLEGETQYTFNINKALMGVDGISMTHSYAWTYMTKSLVARQTYEILADGRESVNLHFNYAIEPTSLSWTMMPSATGDLSWSADNKRLTFTTHGPLLAGSRYAIELGDQLYQLNGQPAPQQKEINVFTDDLTTGREPQSGSSDNNLFTTLKIPFRKTVNKQQVAAGLTIDPEPLKPIEIIWDGNTLLADLYLASDTYYTVRIERHDLIDLAGNQISGSAIHWGFRTKEIARLAGFGNGPKLQTLQVENDLKRPEIDYSFYRDVQPVPVSFELYEMTLADWQTAPAMDVYGVSAERPLITWEEAPPPFDEERYFHTHATSIPEGVDPGFYRLTMKVFDQPQDHLAILITDVALAFRLEGQTMLAWVVDIETLTPITADVTLYQDSQSVLTGQTDQDGFVSLSVAGLPIDENEGPLFTITAEAGEQFTIATLAYPWHSFTTQREEPPPYSLHITMDRPVYQAGDTAHIRVVLRQSNQGRLEVLPPGQTVTATLKGRDSNHNLIESAPIYLTTGEYGVAYGEMVIPANFENSWGNYAAVYYRGVTKNLSFEVAEAQPDAAPIVRVTTAPIVGQGAQLEATIEVKDSNGVPLADQEVEIMLLESVGSDGCFGSGGINEWMVIETLETQARTDQNGQYSLAITAEMGYGSHRLYSDNNMEHSIAAVLATVEHDGATGKGFSVFEVASVNEELRWLPGNKVQAAGQPFLVQGTITDLLGAPVVGRTVSLRLHHVGDNDINYFYEPGQLISQVNGTSDAEGRLAMGLTVKEPGYYELRMVSQDSFGNEMLAYRPLYVTGSGESRNVPGLKLAMGSEDYLVGQTGQLVILAAEPGLAWLTMVNQNGTRNETITLTEPVTVLDLPFTAADAPWLYVQVDMWRQSRDEVSEHEYYGSSYSRRDGDLLSRSLSVQVTDLDKNLTVTVVETGEVNAAGQTAVTLQVLNGRGEPIAAEVALSIVNDALYSHFPNHSSEQYSSLFIRPSISHSLYHSLAPRRDLSYQYGGGCGCGGGWWGDIRLPGLGNELPSFWFPGLHTDFNGQVTILVTLPENPDGWHFSASAITADGQVGEGGGQLAVNSEG